MRSSVTHAFTALQPGRSSRVPAVRALARESRDPGQRARYGRKLCFAFLALGPGSRLLALEKRSLHSPGTCLTRTVPASLSNRSSSGRQRPRPAMTMRLFEREFPDDRMPLLRWLMFTGVSGFGFVLAWHY